MDEIREQQEGLARLHFEMDSKQETLELVINICPRFSGMVGVIIISNHNYRILA